MQHRSISWPTTHTLVTLASLAICIQAAGDVIQTLQVGGTTDTTALTLMVGSGILAVIHAGLDLLTRRSKRERPSYSIVSTCLALLVLVFVALLHLQATISL